MDVKRIQKITKVLSLILAVVEAVAMGVGFGKKRTHFLNSDTMSYPTYFLSILLVILYDSRRNCSSYVAR